MDTVQLPSWIDGLSQDLQLAIRAAASAGQVITAGAADLRGTVVESKSVGDLVSQVDRDADLAATTLLRENSALPILSEELHHDVGEQNDLWIVDPLDGSSAFLTGAGAHLPSVLIAQVREGVAQVGVCYFPLANEWFYAQRGRGAWKDGKRLVCDAKESLAEVWVEMNQYGDARFETAYFRDLKERLRSDEGARLVTSQAPHAGVAMRIAECQSSLAVAVHDNNSALVKQGPWDIAAPQLILEEAGGVFLNPKGGRTDSFTCEPIIVARSLSLAREVLELGICEPSHGT